MVGRARCVVSSFGALAAPPCLPAFLPGRVARWGGSHPAPRRRGVSSSPLVSARLRVFGAVFPCVALASFCRLGWLFSGLGWLFSRLGGVGCPVFFRIFVSWSVPALRFLPRSPRLLPWFVCSGGRAFSAGSRCRCRVSPCRLGFPARVVSPLLAPGSLPGSAAILVAPGGWAGRSPRLALLRWVCRSARVACRLPAFSFRSFSRFAVWHPPCGFLVC